MRIGKYPVGPAIATIASLCLSANALADDAAKPKPDFSVKSTNTTVIGPVAPGLRQCSPTRTFGQPAMDDPCTVKANPPKKEIRLEMAPRLYLYAAGKNVSINFTKKPQ
jgi:hypothetical protein